MDSHEKQPAWHVMKPDSVYLRYTFNDLGKNKGVNISLFVILVLSAFLVATGAMVMERLFGSVDELFESAKPPHFLQMHKGDYDPAALERFASRQPLVESWLVEEMVGFDGAAIAWQRPATDASGDLSDSLVDNLFVTQNEDFDFLLDQNGAIPRPSPGEVYVPVSYQQEYALQAGDRLQVGTGSGVQELRIEGFVRDAQMASSLSEATRFLVSESDFVELEHVGGGSPEIIAEFLLTDVSQAANFQTVYDSTEALPKNGPAVTYQQIRLINAFSDGMAAVALIFVGLLLIVISLLNARFVIRGTLQDEVREIGALKAIGIPGKEIARLYLAKYRVMTFLACGLGGALGVLATELLTRSVQVNYAKASFGTATILVPLLALAIVYLLVIAICRRVLGAVRKIQVVAALVHGSTRDERQTARRAKRQAKRARRDRLASYRGGNLNLRLALMDVQAESRQWILVPIVFFLISVLVTLPLNLLSTFESPRFITYMGAAETDLRADIQFSEDVDAVRGEVLAAMRDDDRLTNLRIYSNVLYETEGEEGLETLRVEVGDYSDGTIEYLEGAPPEPGQIALSVLNADKYRLTTGDEMTVSLDGESTTAEVSGIYQDVTAGGLTAKMQGEVTTGAAAYVIYADTVGGTEPGTIATEYGEDFPAASVIPMREYVQQTLSYLTDAFRGATVLSFGFGIGVAVLITSLFLKLRLTSERRKMGTLSAIGFSTGEIITQVRVKTLLAVALGTLLGLGFAATAGESMVAAMISLAGLGITELAFIPNPLLAYAAYPLTLIAAGCLGAMVLTARLRRADRSSWLKG